MKLVLVLTIASAMIGCSPVPAKNVIIKADTVEGELKLLNTVGCDIEEYHRNTARQELFVKCRHE